MLLMWVLGTRLLFLITKYLVEVDEKLDRLARWVTRHPRDDDFSLWEEDQQDTVIDLARYRQKSPR